MKEYNGERSIYITYNTKSEIEKNTALRLQTISYLYGLTVELPARLMSEETVSAETKNRIARNEYVVVFSFSKTSKEVLEEIKLAISLKKTIIVVHDNLFTFNFGTYSKVTSVLMNFENTETTLHEIASFFKSQTSNKPKVKSSKNDDIPIVLGVLGIALGLFALWAGTKNSTK